MEVMEEMVGVKRESVTCLVVRLELERSISVFTSFLEVSTINMAVEVEREKEKVWFAMGNLNYVKTMNFPIN